MGSRLCSISDPVASNRCAVPMARPTHSAEELGHATGSWSLFSRRAVLIIAGLGTAAILAMTVFGASLASGTVANGYNETLAMSFTIAKGNTSGYGNLNPAWGATASTTAVCTLQSDPGTVDLVYVTVNPTNGRVREPTSTEPQRRLSGGVPG